MAETTERDIEELLAAGTAGIAPPLITGIPWYHPPEFAEVYTQKELDRTFRYIYDYLSSIGIDNKLLNEDILADALYSGKFDAPGMLRIHSEIQDDLIQLLNKKLFLAVDSNTESITRSTGKLLENIYTMEEAIYGIPIDEGYRHKSFSGKSSTSFGLTMFDHNTVLFDETGYILKELKNAINEPDMPTRKVLKMLKEGKFNHLPDIDEIVAVLGSEVVNYISDIKIERLARSTFLPETAYITPLIEGLTLLSGRLTGEMIDLTETAEGLPLIDKADNILREQGITKSVNANPLSLWKPEELLEIGVKPNTKTPFRDLYLATKRILTEGVEEFIDAKSPLFASSLNGKEFTQRIRIEDLNHIFGFDWDFAGGKLNFFPSVNQGSIFQVLEEYADISLNDIPDIAGIEDMDWEVYREARRVPDGDFRVIRFMDNILGVPGSPTEMGPTYNYERWSESLTESDSNTLQRYEEIIREPKRVLFAQGKWNDIVSGEKALDTLEFSPGTWHSLSEEKFINRLIEYGNELGKEVTQTFVLRDVKSGTIQPIPFLDYNKNVYGEILRASASPEALSVKALIRQARINKSPIAIYVADYEGDILRKESPIARSLINRLKAEDFNLITKDMYAWTGMEDMVPSEIEDMKIDLAKKGEAKLVSSTIYPWNRDKPKKSLEVQHGVDISKQASTTVVEPPKKRTVMEQIRDIFRGTQGRQGLEIAEETIKSNPKFFSKVLNVLAKLDVGEEVIRRTLQRIGTKYAATSVTGPVAAGLAVYETAVLIADVVNASARAADKDVDFWDNFGNIDDKYSITYKLTKPFYETVFKGISNLSELSNEDNQVES
jgi:hypothetical protein